MKTILLILLFALTAASQTIPEQVKTFEKPKRYTVSYDKFEKTHSVSWRTTLVSTEKKKASTWLNASHSFVSMEMVAYFPEQTSIRPNRTYLYFSQPSSRTLYNHTPLKFLIDGDLTTLESNDIDYSVMYEVTPALVERIVKAKKVEIQLAGVEAVWPEDVMTVFRNIASLKCC